MATAVRSSLEIAQGAELRRIADFASEAGLLPWTATDLLDYQFYGCGIVLGTPIP